MQTKKQHHQTFLEPMATSCGAQNSLLVITSQNFDRCAISSSLYLPPAAVRLNAWSLTIGSEQTKGYGNQFLQ